ncbi:conjugal transfer protein TraO [Muribaculum intestinale]|uniref:conjugal transfer protein TraO n=1 Tax=Muribaculum intestinale TaxID=1796646 RepID=UPI003F6627B6
MNGLSVENISRPIKPYGESGRIPIADFTAEVGYNLHLFSNYSQFFHLYGGISALGGYETVNWGKTLLSDGATLHDSDAFIYLGFMCIGDLDAFDSLSLGNYRHMQDF